MSKLWRKTLKALEIIVLGIGSLIAIGIVALVIYGLHTDCEPSPGIYLKHCPIG